MAAVVDIHVHLLPGIDDGPATMEASVALARALVDAGVSTAAATPHVREDHPRVVPAELAGRCADLRAALDDAGVALEVAVGGEIDLLWAGRAGDDDLRAASYGQQGAYLLVETPYTPLPRHFEELLFEVQVRGPGIVLAHPERNPTFQQDTARLEALAERGILLQVTASSLAGGGSGSGRTARELVRRGVAHVIASDAHSADGRGRSHLIAGVEVAERLAPGRGEWMASDAPAGILAGTLPEPPPARPAGLRERIGRRLRPGG
jgi:protein-tyrosine phosphatase